MKRTYPNLAAFLEDTDTTLQTFADLIGTWPSYVSMVKDGKRTPSLPLAIRIAEIARIPIASLVATTTTHAREWTGETTLECSGALHSEGDADQSQGDGDKAMPHHHGSCHGPAAAVPVTMALDHVVDTRSGYIGRSVAALPSRVLDPALRPPQA